MQVKRVYAGLGGLLHGVTFGIVPAEQATLYMNERAANRPDLRKPTKEDLAIARMLKERR